MDIDLLASLVIFIVAISIVVIFFSNYLSQLPLWRSLGQLRDVAMEVKNKLFSSKGITTEIYRVQVLVEEDAGLERINEPVEVEIVTDEACSNKSLNNSIRIQDENWVEIPFLLEDFQTCSGNYISSAKVLFNVNLSPYERKIFQIFYHNNEVAPPSYNVSINTSSWIPSDGDSWTESLTDWSSVATLSLSTERKVGNYSLNVTGNFASGKIDLVYNPSITIDGVKNGWYLRSWIWVDNKSDLRIWVEISDGNENISYEITDIESNQWYLFEKEISNEWRGWQSFNASKGIDYIKIYATNQTSGLTRTLKVDGLRFEKKPLKVTVFPEERVEIISREKLEEYRNKTAEEIIGILGKGYKIRIEIKKP